MAKSSKNKKPAKFSDSFTTRESTFSVDVKRPWGDCNEAVVVKIDCIGEVSGDEDTIDVLIEMLEKAKANLMARRGV